MNSVNASTTISTGPGLAQEREVQSVTIPLNGNELPAELVLPVGARGLVLFLVGCGCVRETPRSASIARRIQAAGMATLTLALLTTTEAQKDHQTGCWSFDLDLLTHRLLRATGWAMQQPPTRDLGIGYIGTSTFAAAALVAAGQLGYAVQAVVARAGRPDFAGDWLPKVSAPTLLIVGERDESMLALNRAAQQRLACPNRLAVVAGASHLFEEPGTLAQVGELAADWFASHLKPIKRISRAGE